MFYVDTSVMIAALTIERETASALRWLADNQGAGLVASHWLTTEVASGLARKVRARELTADRQMQAWKEYRRLASESFQMLPVEARYFEAAADLILFRPSGLRAGDALHLAVAVANDLPMVTFDRGLVAAATRLGHVVSLLS